MLQHLITQNDELRMVPTNRDELAGAVEGLCEELRALPADADPDRGRVLARWIGVGLVSLGAPRDAQPFLRRALDLATASGSPGAVIATQLNLGDAYRYDGNAPAADALYRGALDSARRHRADLVDYALQHFGKHLMERGDLLPARVCLREALSLRQAKGEAGLVESTQAALDRVELLIGQGGAGASTADAAEAARWSSGWTSWLQSRTTTRAPERWAEEFGVLRDAVRDLTAHERVKPLHLRDQPFPAELIAAMAQEAEKALAAEGYLHNGKWNAPVGTMANCFAAQVDLAAVVARSTGLEVEQPHTGVYIAYLEEGQHLDVHVDQFGFGEANLILCLKHERPTAALTVSATVFIGADGYVKCPLAPGEAVVFDGALTPHGRTPLAGGERVVLVSFGFRARDRAARTIDHLPPVPR